LPLEFPAAAGLKGSRRSADALAVKAEERPEDILADPMKAPPKRNPINSGAQPSRECRSVDGMVNALGCNLLEYSH
jgi:hypothetical protein